jgi:hypothetical protein
VEQSLLEQDEVEDENRDCVEVNGRNTKVNGRNNAAPVTQGMIGAAWRLSGRNPEIGVVMR